ncbi:potassium channel family protein [Jannaschia marina]|uniref:potassium channel family protein n=1 Tax=Jannaschia marina TaxID=2741674 RepID=UPI0015C9A719|nr:potassium channel family protein [Jannaschia marina]
MALLEQTSIGTFLLAACVLVHVGGVASCAYLLRGLGRRLAHAERSVLSLVAILTAGTFVLLAAHGVQIWIWAAVIFSLDIVATWEAAGYFAAVSYTTLGYGDITAGPAYRVLVTFSAMTGLFTFGLSTAVLLAIVLRTMPSILDDGRTAEPERAAQAPE